MVEWRTAITKVERNKITLRGYNISELMGEIGFGEAVFLALVGRMPSKEEATLFNAMLVASVDHGPTAPSALASRVATSGNRASLEAAVGAGVLTIGDVHGGAGERTAQILSVGVQRMRRSSLTLEQAAEQIVDELAKRNEHIPGLGHPLHTEDPRAARLFELASRLDFAGEHTRLLTAIQEALAKLGKRLPINVDGAMAAIICDMGLDARLSKLLFIIARVAGLCAHVIEEMDRERPMRFMFQYSYDGPSERRLSSTS